MNLWHTNSNEEPEVTLAAALILPSDGPQDRYDEYLSVGDEPKDSANNARNLFHESNQEDKKWFGVARKHLNQR